MLPPPRAADDWRVSPAPRRRVKSATTGNGARPPHRAAGPRRAGGPAGDPPNPNRRGAAANRPAGAEIPAATRRSSGVRGTQHAAHIAPRPGGAEIPAATGTTSAFGATEHAADTTP